MGQLTFEQRFNILQLLLLFWFITRCIIVACLCSSRNYSLDNYALLIFLSTLGNLCLMFV